MKTSEMCRRAAEVVRKQPQTPACFALGSAAGAHLRAERPENLQQLLDRIDLSLDPHGYVTQWLHAKHNVPKKQLSTKPGSPNWHYFPTPEVQDYRRRWLLALAAEYEARGD
jgi:hypothetical protein